MADDLAKIKARLHGGITKLPNADRPSVIQQAKDKAKESAEALLKAHARQLALQNRAFEPGSVTKVSDPQALSEMAGDMLAGPLSFMPAGIIKEKGGNWLDKTLTDYLDRYKFNNIEQQLNPPTRAEIEQMTPQMQEVWNNVYKNAEQNNVVNKWIDSNLKNYIKNQMGTKEDPVRELAEKGISHLNTAGRDLNASSILTEDLRKRVGYPEFAISETPLAKYWENLSDSHISPHKVGVIKKVDHDDYLSTHPWLDKKADEDIVYAMKGSRSRLGFDHIVDVLKQDLASGAIRPEQLNKVSMADAVMRAHLFDQEMAKKMAKTQLQAQTEMPVHKDYGESGYKWYELKHPSNSEITEQALKYEGDTMGHCVGGYCPDVLEGRTKIYSLRDAKGEPHVTVEVQPQGLNLKFSDLVKTLGDEKANELIEHPSWSKGLSERKDLIRNYFAEAGVDLPAEQFAIKQIKGKQNAAPKDEYVPYVQDFVRSGNWHNDIGDFSNTGLIDPQSALAATHLSINNATDKLGGRRYLTQDEFQTLMKGGELPPLD